MKGSLRRRPRRYRVPRGLLGPRDLAGEYLRRDARERLRYGVSIVLGLVAYTGAGLWMWRQATRPPAPRLVVTATVQLERRPAPPPPPAPPAESPPPLRPLRQARRSTAPPAAAMAGKVIARAADPSAPLDMTAFAVVQGKSETYAGGYTASSGTSANAVSNPNATAHGTGQGGLARTAAPSRKDWACAWPDEAQAITEVRDVRVPVRVHLDADGSPQSVDVVSGTPPSGFADAARQCALAEAYRPALDDQGHRIPGITPLFVVHFVR